MSDLRCPECDGIGRVWGDYNGMEIEAECPYCGGSGRALRGALIRDGYPVPPDPSAGASDANPSADRGTTTS